MRQALRFGLWIILASAISGCSGAAAGLADAVLGGQSVDAVTAEDAGESNDTAQVTPADTVNYDRDDLDSQTDDVNTFISLLGDSFDIEGSGTTVNGNTLTIFSAGTYSISGVLEDGRIIVNSEDKDVVKLILNGADLTSSSSAPIYVYNAEKTVITLADGTDNSVTDAASYVLDDPGSGEPDAAVFSNDDLTINGGGSLTVSANFKNGIASDDDLKITGGTITVTAVNDGIQGRDSIAVMDGNLTVTAVGDGLRANNDDEADQGYIVIEGGNILIEAGSDGIQAETNITLSGGTVSITAGGGSGTALRQAGQGQGPGGNTSTNGGADDSTDAPRGLQAGLRIDIIGGTIDVDAADDALHSHGTLAVTGGQITLASGDDGVHAETDLLIDGGELSVTQSYEGLESKAITINGGTIHIVASDDGINGSSGQGDQPGMGGPGGMGESGDSSLTVNGGYIAVDATGDGLDIAGPITMTDGLVIVNGPTSNGDGPVDYLGSFEINGGIFLAVGSAGMAEGPSAGSTQPALMLTLSSLSSAGTVMHIETQEGQDILTFAPIREIQSVVFSSPSLKMGETYQISLGGSGQGEAVDGLYADGSSSAGTELASITIEDTVTYFGTAAGGFNGGPGGGRPGGAPPQRQ